MPDNLLLQLFDIRGKVVIVTGGNRGNGLAVSTALVSLGAHVQRLDKEFDSIIGSNDFPCDITDPIALASAVDRIYKTYGCVDGLVNNAGISLQSDDPYRDSDVLRRTLAVNLEASFNLTALVCPLMAQGTGGSIVNITSLGSKLGFPGNPACQISKAGLSQLSRSIARDWGEKGIRANNVGPGYIRTQMTEASFNNPDSYNARLEKTMLKRWGEPKDIVGSVVFLLSSASSYITGSDIWVDGGWAAKGL